jgi:YbgC/YbaW family acyl-CoA thioester hydrolase
MPFHHDVTVAWGDCDEAGIVFYPNYFYWLDSAFQALLRAHGLSQRSLRTRFGALGTPIVEAGAKFLGPVTYEDVLRLEVCIARWGRKSFRVAYRGFKDGELVLEGFEARIWAVPTESGRLTSAEIPAAIRAALSRAPGDVPPARTVC